MFLVAGVMAVPLVFGNTSSTKRKIKRLVLLKIWDRIQTDRERGRACAWFHSYQRRTILIKTPYLRDVLHLLCHAHIYQTRSHILDSNYCRNLAPHCYTFKRKCKLIIGLNKVDRLTVKFKSNSTQHEQSKGDWTEIGSLCSILTAS